MSLGATQPSNSSVVRCSDSGSGQRIWLQGWEIRSRQSRSWIRGWWPSVLSLSAKTVLAGTELESDHVFVSFWSFRLLWESKELLERHKKRAQQEKNNPITILDLSLLGVGALILGGEQFCFGVFKLLPPHTRSAFTTDGLRELLHFFRLLEVNKHLGTPCRCQPDQSAKPSWRWSYLGYICHCACKEPSSWGDQDAAQAASVFPPPTHLYVIS